MLQKENKSVRHARLSIALRENLRKRKEQLQQRRAQELSSPNITLQESSAQCDSLVKPHKEEH